MIGLGLSHRLGIGCSVVGLCGGSRLGGIGHRVLVSFYGGDWRGFVLLVVVVMIAVMLMLMLIVVSLFGIWGGKWFCSIVGSFLLPWPCLMLSYIHDMWKRQCCRHHCNRIQ